MTRDQRRLYVTAAGLLRANYMRVDEVVPVFVEVLKEDPYRSDAFPTCTRGRASWGFT
jgi:hypothetical protein